MNESKSAICTKEEAIRRNQHHRKKIWPSKNIRYCISEVTESLVVM